MANKTSSLCKSHGGVADERVLLQNYMISKLNRGDLEDRYYSLWNSNIGLKKRLNAQNEKIKFLNTKLARLTNQQKKDSIISDKCCRDFEDIIEEQALRIHQLQKFNYNLIEKIEFLETHVSTLNVSHIENNNYVEKFKTENMRDNNSMYKEMFELTPIKEYSRSLEPITENDVESMEEKVAALEMEIEKLKEESLHRTLSEKNIYDVTNKENAETNVMDETEINNEQEISLIHIYTQTDSSINNEMLLENEMLNKKLAEEHLIILELQQKIESDKLKHDILDIVQSRLDTLNEKMIIEHNNNTNEIKKVQCIEEHKTLEKELWEAKINIESLKLVNTQLGVQILELQTKVDIFSLQNVSNHSNNEILTSKNEESYDETGIDTVNNPKENKSINEIVIENIPSNENTFPNQTVTLSNTVEDELKIGNANNTAMDKQEIEIHAVEINTNSVENTTNSGINIPNISISEHDNNDFMQTQLNTQSGLTPICASPNSFNKDNIGCNNLREEQSDSSSDVLLNDATYDISTNDSSQCSNTPMNSLSEGYLSDGEVRKDSIINFQRGKSKCSTLSQLSNVKVTDKPKMFFDEHETTMKNTIDEIAKEMEKCEKLLNRDQKLIKQKSTSANFPSMERFNARKMATFILHIVSVELSQKATDLQECDLYFLTWKFYNEIVAYTPQYGNKISYFNFCSTYNVVADDDFISYLTKKSIQIDIHQATGELSKLLASCEINLLDVLNKVNKRVDYVLNLEKFSEGNGKVNYGELKCWCKLTWDSSTT